MIRPDERQPLPIPSPEPLLPPKDFAQRLQENGIQVSAEALAKIGDYLARLLAMNEKMNLTAIDDPIVAWERHAFDALTLGPAVARVPTGERVIDIGSGGGLPAVPLAIVRPDVQFTLVESTQKKAAFLSSVATILGLTNVDVRAERAEKLATGPLRGTCAAVTARAVARLSELVPITAPFAKAGGRLLLIKGQKAKEELAEAARIMVKQRVKFVEMKTTLTGTIVVLEKG
ncbi:MAG TPA: 16S rRNA (guanine(527)-N(7))-methyltransferase RsmG [Polyangium sp.]|nr:16S rRNA (guanine(527)-N(7))-methyltransferase RsmG [Polyangium sp.]